MPRPGKPRHFWLYILSTPTGRASPAHSSGVAKVVKIQQFSAITPHQPADFPPFTRVGGPRQGPIRSKSHPSRVAQFQSHPFPETPTPFVGVPPTNLLGYPSHSGLPTLSHSNNRIDPFPPSEASTKARPKKQKPSVTRACFKIPISFRAYSKSSILSVPKEYSNNTF